MALFGFIAGLFAKSKRMRRVERSPHRTARPGSETLRISQVPTLKLDDTEAPESARDDVFIEWYGLSEVGRVRAHNEDYFSCTVLDNAGLFIVADGMGGHDKGEVASRLAVETATRYIKDRMKNGHEPLMLVKEAVEEANREVMKAAAENGSNMGTTIAAALVTDGSAYIASVGDSRAYWATRDSIRQLTEDHSLVARLVAAGRLTKEEARNHPKSNLLYRTIGSEENLQVDTFQIEIEKGGAVLLCTDGLWGEVSDHDMHMVMKREMSAQDAVLRLVQKANDNGGKDNITAVMVKIR